MRFHGHEWVLSAGVAVKGAASIRSPALRSGFLAAEAFFLIPAKPALPPRLSPSCDVAPATPHKRVLVDLVSCVPHNSLVPKTGMAPEPDALSADNFHGIRELSYRCHEVAVPPARHRAHSAKEAAAKGVQGTWEIFATLDAHACGRRLCRAFESQ